MKFKAKALLGLLIGCMVLISNTSVRAQESGSDSIFNSPVEIEMNVRMIGSWGKGVSEDNNISENTIHDAYVRTVYLSQDKWYQESHEETIGQNKIPIIKKMSWDGTIFKSLTVPVEDDSILDPTFKITEKYESSFREINPLLYVYELLRGDNVSVTAEHKNNKVYTVNKVLDSETEFSAEIVANGKDKLSPAKKIIKKG